MKLLVIKCYRRSGHYNSPVLTKMGQRAASRYNFAKLLWPMFVLFWFHFYSGCTEEPSRHTSLSDITSDNYIF